MTDQTDVQIENSGNILLVTPLTPAARQWVEENVSIESWQWQGGSVAVEPRCLDNLVAGMKKAGLKVN